MNMQQYDRLSSPLIFPFLPPCVTSGHPICMQ